jgi:hypothetical protein
MLGRRVPLTAIRDPLVGTPCDQSLPFGSDLFRPLADISRSFEQKENMGRDRPRPESINGSKSAPPKTVGPMLYLREVATLPGGVMVIDDQTASGSRELAQFGEQDAFAGFGPAVLVAPGLKAEIGVNEYQVAFFEDMLDVFKPFQPSFLAASYWAIHRYQVTGENRSWEDIGSFQRPNIPLPRGHDLIEGVEKGRIEMPPHLWPIQVANVSPIFVIVLIWK